MLMYDKILLAQMRYQEMIAEAEKRAKYRRDLPPAPGVFAWISGKIGDWLTRRRTTAQARITPKAQNVL